MADSELEAYKRGAKPEGKAAATLRDARMDEALGEGAEERAQLREEKRKVKIARYQGDLGPELERELEVARLRKELASGVVDDPETLFGSLNEVMKHTGQPPINSLPVSMSPEIVALYKSLMTGNFRPTDHPILKKANITAEYEADGNENGEDEEELEEEDELEARVVEGRVEGSVGGRVEGDDDGTSSSTLQHYIRVWTVEKAKLQVWAERFPVDFARIRAISGVRAISESSAISAVTSAIPAIPAISASSAISADAADADSDTHITLVYVGACIANTPLGRLEQDGKGSNRGDAAYSILKRFMKLDISVAPPDSYEILPLSLQLPHAAGLDGLDAWDCSPEAWAIEQSLIAAASCSLNSAFGGRFVDWRLEEDVEQLVGECTAYRPSQTSSDFPAVLGEQIRELFEQARGLAKDLNAKPISNSSLRTAAAEATGGERLADMTTVGVNIAKDITLRDAFTGSSWYGAVTGPAPRNYRLAQDVAMGLAVTPSMKPSPSGAEAMKPSGAEADKSVVNQEFENEDNDANEEEDEIEAEGIVPPHPRYGRAFQDARGLLHIYMAFVDFWAVCLDHTWVMIFYVILIRYLLILRPRVMIVSSDKVSTILRLGPILPAGALVVPIKDLALLFGDLNIAIQWKDTAGGEFFRLWVGRIVVVRISEDNWSIMLIRFHNGYMAYRPAFQRVLYQMNIILALMSQVLTRLARRRPVWSEAIAREVAAEAEELFDQLRLTEVFEKYRDELLRLQRAYLGLSGLRARVYNDVIEEHEQALQDFLSRGAQMSATRTQTLANSLVAIGLPGSIEREDQIEHFSSAGPLAGLPCPSSMTFGNDDWKCWLRTRREGVVLVESARSLVTPIEVSRQLAIAARKGRNAKKSTTPFPGYYGKTTLEEVFMHLVDVDTFTLDRQLTTTGIRLVTCTVCGLRGIVLDKAGRHSCKLPDGTWGPAERVVQKDRWIISQLLLPIQLLVDDDFSEQLVKSETINAAVEWGSSDIEATNQLFPFTMAIRLDQRHRKDAIPFLDLQGHVLQRVDDLIFQRSAKKDVTPESTRAYIRQLLHDTSSQSHMQDAYEHYARMRTLYRRRAGEEVTDDEYDFPLDYGFEVQRRIP